MRTLAAAALLLVLSACSSDDGSGPGGGVGASCDGASGGAALECEILALVNQQRAAGATCGGKTLPPTGPLQMHATLRQVARAHAEDMGAQNYFSHDSLDGRSPFDRMSDAGYKFSTAGENIAAGSSTAAATMQQWMGSSGHCENIMKGAYQHLGVGYANVPANKYKHLWVQTFGAQK